MAVDMPTARSVEIGVGFKPGHFDALQEDMTAADFFEIHAENYLGAGGTPHRQLTAIHTRRPVSIHGVGLSLGGVQAPDPRHLQRLKDLLHRYPTRLFSEHLAWSSHGGNWLPDLLPIAYDEASFRRVASHVTQTQETLGRPILIENPSTYLALADPRSETDFLAELSRTTGCRLLLDLSNLVVSCRNHGHSPDAYLDRFTVDRVSQIHLAGHRVQTLPTGGQLRIDDHGSAVADDVLALYRTTLRRCGAVPTLLEWDNDVPTWPVLAAELKRIRAFAGAALANEAVA